MNAKIPFLFISVLAIFIYSCSDDNGTVLSSDLQAKGSEYFPIAAGKILNAQVSGSATEYDSTGKVINFQAINNEIFNASIGSSTYIGNMIAHPLSINVEGRYGTIGYLVNNNDEIDGFNWSADHAPAIILPAELSVGKEWIVNPQSRINKQVKIRVEEILENYTNTAGRTFQNTIRLSSIYLDSTGASLYYSTQTIIWYEKLFVNVDIYLAREVGLVGARLNEYESVRKEEYYSMYVNYNRFRRVKAVAEMGIVN